MKAPTGGHLREEPWIGSPGLFRFLSMSQYSAGVMIVLPSRDHRLGRNINHDPRSRAFPFPTAGLTLKSVQHERHIPVLNQGNLGSCTGNAGVGCLGTASFFDLWSHGPKRFSLDEGGAVSLYSQATQVDDAPGTYPPVDTGSDGLSIGKVLTTAGEIAGYQHTFSLGDALKALTVTPFITGTYWYTDMFTPDPTGRVRPTGQVAGGHEYVADGLDVENKRVWFSNSWGASWGQQGKFWIDWDDYGQLLAQQGDVTIFTPNSEPSPQPVPVPSKDPADVALATAVRAWSVARHTGSNAVAARAVRAWLAAKQL